MGLPYRGLVHDLRAVYSLRTDYLSIKCQSISVTGQRPQPWKAAKHSCTRTWQRRKKTFRSSFFRRQEVHAKRLRCPAQGSSTSGWCSAFCLAATGGWRGEKEEGGRGCHNIWFAERNRRSDKVAVRQCTWLVSQDRAEILVHSTLDVQPFRAHLFWVALYLAIFWQFWTILLDFS